MQPFLSFLGSIARCALYSWFPSLRRHLFWGGFHPEEKVKASTDNKIKIHNAHRLTLYVSIFTLRRKVYHLKVASSKIFWNSLLSESFNLPTSSADFPIIYNQINKYYMLNVTWVRKQNYQEEFQRFLGSRLPIAGPWHPRYWPITNFECCFERNRFHKMSLSYRKHHAPFEFLEFALAFLTSIEAIVLIDDLRETQILSKMSCFILYLCLPFCCIHHWDKPCTTLFLCWS